MRRVFRIVLAIVKWFAILCGVALLVVLLVNLRDEELTPEARSLAEFHPPAVLEGQNGYLVLVGLDAPAGVDPIAAGARIVADRNASKPFGAERAPTLIDEMRDEGRLKFILVGNVGVWDSLDRPCLPLALDQARNIRAMINANAELVARYLAMQRLPAFADPYLPGSHLMATPTYGAWGATSRLLLLGSALDAQTGNVGRALEFLTADIGMWRRILSGGDRLDVAIAVRGLAADFRLLSDLIAAPAFDVKAHAAEMRQMLVPLSPAEMKLASMFKREFEKQARYLTAWPEEVAKNGTWIERLMSGSFLVPIFFKPNASLNLSAKLFSELQTLGSHPPSDFVRLRDELQIETRVVSEPGITWIYNPIGRMTVGDWGAAIPTYSAYVAQDFDLAAYVQLVRAQLELRLAAVAASQVPAFLAAAGRETRNPYTEQPFQWNAADNSLSFEPMSDRWRRWSTKVEVPPSL